MRRQARHGGDSDVVTGGRDSHSDHIELHTDATVGLRVHDERLFVRRAAEHIQHEHQEEHASRVMHRGYARAFSIEW